MVDLALVSGTEDYGAFKKVFLTNFQVCYTYKTKRKKRGSISLPDLASRGMIKKLSLKQIGINICNENKNIV